MLADDRLSGHEHERMLDEPPDIVAGLVLATLERIGSKVEQLWHPQLDQRLRPHLKPMRLLFHEHSLPLVVAKTGKVAVVGPVEELAALVGALAGEKIALVIAVEVDLEGLAAGIVARSAACP